MVNAYQVGTQFMVERGSGKFPPEPDNPNHYWELSQQTDYERVFTLRSTEPSHTVQDLRTKETLRDENRELMRRLELQRNDNNFLSRENEELKEINKTLNRSLIKLEADVETKECQGEAVVNPEWEKQANLHEERMRLENESMSLDNLLKRAEYNGYKDYPKSVWERLDSRTRDLLHSIENRTTVIWVAFVAFAVNEVIQWLTR